MTWRVGRRNPHALYFDLGAESIPHGFVLDPEIAQRIAAAMNAQVGKPSRWAPDPHADECDRLRAKVEHLRGLVTMTSEAAGTLAADCTSLHDSLAAANALLDEWLGVDAAASNTPQRLLDRVHAHLYTQPGYARQRQQEAACEALLDE